VNPLDRAIDSQAEAWLVALIKAKLDAGSDAAYRSQVESELEAETMRDFGYPRGPCTPRSMQR